MQDTFQNVEDNWSVENIWSTPYIDQYLKQGAQGERIIGENFVDPSWEQFFLSKCIGCSGIQNCNN